MMNRKLTAVLATLVMVFAVSGTAFATEESSIESASSVSSVSSASADESSSTADSSEDSESSASTSSDSDADSTAADSESNTSASDDNASENDMTGSGSTAETEGTDAPANDDVAADDVAAPSEEDAADNTEFDVVLDPSVDEEFTVDADVTEDTVEMPEVPTVEVPTVEVPVEEIPVVAEEAELVILHLFESSDVVCEDYETVTGLTAGDEISLEDYSYSDKYEFAKCLNGSETATLNAGQNTITILYTLDSGYVIL